MTPEYSRELYGTKESLPSLPLFKGEVWRG